MLEIIIKNFILVKKESSISFMLTNLVSKSFSALTHLYAISIYLKLHSPGQASAILVLIGYLIWFQFFEFGISQAIQNKFNQKKISLNSIISLISIHYFFIIVIGLVIANSNFFSELLLSNNNTFSIEDKKNFSIGTAIFLISSCNLIAHRLLLIIKKGNSSNLIILIQSLITLISLFFYSHSNVISQLNSMLIYVLPQAITTSLIIIWLWLKKYKLNSKVNKFSFVELIKCSSGFFLINTLSSLMLGMDYYFMSRYAANSEIIEYHVIIRFFYISFTIYYAYLIHASKRIAHLNTINIARIKKVTKQTLQLGFSSVTIVFLVLIFLINLDYINFISNQTEISYSICFSALIYFLIRVYSDTRLVITNNLSYINILIKIYLLQILISMSLMTILIPKFGGIGALASMSIAYISGLIYSIIKKPCY